MFQILRRQRWEDGGPRLAQAKTMRVYLKNDKTKRGRGYGESSRKHLLHKCEELDSILVLPKKPKDHMPELREADIRKRGNQKNMDCC
jgi:hypothetical protein